jgi:NAD(P)-dependent dehydrogenase (short-subunit alcohol dehydrogenase family)
MKNVIITGATGNLGKSVVDRFLLNGYQVLITHTPGKAPQNLPSGTLPYEADLTNEAATTAVIANMIRTHGTIDAAVLLVGGFMPGGLDKADGAAVHRMISLNFNTAYYVARPIFQQMMNQPNGGRIIVVGARPVLRPKDGKNLMAYTLSKSLIFKLAELLNAEGEAKNVVTSVIAPSTIDTETNRQAMPTADFSKWVNPKDIADTMVFLCSQPASALRQNVLKMYGEA